jgi:hypothetical protein
MGRYVVFAVDDNEDSWASASEETKQATYDADERFLKLLQERGGRVVGGAELSHSRDTRVLHKGSDDTPLVTDGPYAEAVEQVSGFYIVECDDLTTLTEAAALMLPGHLRLEIRATPEH